MTETERFADQFLGQRVGDAKCKDVLKALRGHILGSVVLYVEAPGGATVMHVRGTLVESSPDPSTWGTTKDFAVIGPGVDAQLWHLDEGFREQLGEPAIQPAARFRVPKHGIEEYLSEDPGSSGYRFVLGGGTTVALVLWHGVLHVTPGGDVAPGLGGFEATLDTDDE